MIKIQTTDKLAFLSLLVAGITFPVSGQYILQFLDWGFKEIFIYGSWVFLGASVYLIGYIFSRIFKPEPINIPAKKTSKAAYIKT